MSQPSTTTTSSCIEKLVNIVVATVNKLEVDLAKRNKALTIMKKHVDDNTFPADLNHKFSSYQLPKSTLPHMKQHFEEAEAEAELVFQKSKLENRIGTTENLILYLEKELYDFTEYKVDYNVKINSLFPLDFPGFLETDYKNLQRLVMDKITFQELQNHLKQQEQQRNQPPQQTAMDQEADPQVRLTADVANLQKQIIALEKSMSTLNSQRSRGNQPTPGPEANGKSNNYNRRPIHNSSNNNNSNNNSNNNNVRPIQQRGRSPLPKQEQQSFSQHHQRQQRSRSTSQGRGRGRGRGRGNRGRGSHDQQYDRRSRSSERNHRL